MSNIIAQYFTNITSATSWTTSATTSSKYYPSYSRYSDVAEWVAEHHRRLNINEGQEATITLPNNVIIEVAKDGNYTINDDGVVKYKGCKIREFNRYVGASDLLEEFIRFMGSKFNVRQGDILSIPIELFINWLIIRACEEDGDDIPFDVKRIEDHSFVKKTRAIPRCKKCGRFISNLFVQRGLVVCSQTCFAKLSTT